MEQVVEPSNMRRAYKRVLKNRGAAGVDRLTVEELKDWLLVHWSSVKTALLEGRYLPRAVRRVDIPKSNGGVRTLGVPTVVDRLIQQALHQVLQPIFEPTFSDGSESAGQRAMANIRAFLEGHLKLRINEQKSAVARPWKRKFLGYAITIYRNEARVRAAPQSLRRLMDRVRELLRKGRGRSLPRTIETLNPVLRGWANYFRLTANMRALDELDWWLRRRLRCLLWRQWKTPKTRERRLISLGLKPERAWKSSVNGRGPWWNSASKHMNQAVPTLYFAQMGLVSLRSTV